MRHHPEGRPPSTQGVEHVYTPYERLELATEYLYVQRQQIGYDARALITSPYTPGDMLEQTARHRQSYLEAFTELADAKLAYHEYRSSKQLNPYRDFEFANPRTPTWRQYIEDLLTESVVDEAKLRERELNRAVEFRSLRERVAKLFGGLAIGSQSHLSQEVSPVLWEYDQQDMWQQCKGRFQSIPQREQVDAAALVDIATGMVHEQQVSEYALLDEIGSTRHGWD